MAILDIFKKRKKEEKKEVKPKEEVVKKEEVEKPKEPKPREEAPKVKVVKKKPTEISKEAYRVLRAPHVTEKATDLTTKNQYIFKVWPRANKPEIKKAIEGIYGVEVVDVKIINVPARRRRLGRISGWRKGYKKAIIKIKEGQKIEVLPR